MPRDRGRDQRSSGLLRRHYSTTAAEDKAGGRQWRHGLPFRQGGRRKAGVFQRICGTNSKIAALLSRRSNVTFPENRCRTFASDDRRPRRGFLLELENVDRAPHHEGIRRRLCFRGGRRRLRKGAKYDPVQMEYRQQNRGHRIEFGQARQIQYCCEAIRWSPTVSIATTIRSRRRPTSDRVFSREIEEGLQSKA